MNIPVNAEVRCTDDVCGRSARVIINPATQQVTHVVVAGDDGAERMVPIDHIMETTPDMIRLTDTCDAFGQEPAFRETEYITGVLPMATYAPGAYVLWPYLTPAAGIVPLEHERVPPGELSVRRGAPVEANDGHVGRVDAFLVDPADGRISHLIMTEGHLWGKKNVSIPVGQIDHVEEDKVYLKLSKDAVSHLPEIPVTPGNKE